MTHIAIDMDDVLVDFIGGVVTALKTEYDADIPFESTGDFGWDISPLFNPIIGYSWWTWLKQREWLWATFPAMPGAIGHIERLRSDGYYLELLTSKPRWAEHNVWKWLGKWRPSFNTVTIIDSSNAALRKVDFTTAEILVDDKPKNCQEFIDDGRNAILFSRPHNRDAMLKHSGQDQGWGELANDWNDVYRIIREKTSG